jgi:hypothetical protein
MASRRDYYFRQKVTEAELDAGFNGLEQADFNLAIDHELTGITTGLTVSEAAAPDLTVDVALGTAYSKQGERIRVSGTQNVDCSQDDSGTPTTVAVPGNTKVVSVFIEFDRSLSDPRIDGNSLTVYFQRDESYNFSVIQGAEALIGTEVPPSLDSGKLLLADIRIENGTAQILNAHAVGAYDQIDTTRREDAFKFTGGAVEIVEGSAHDAFDALLTGLNNHIDGLANVHPADEVSFVDSATWRDGTTLGGATVVDDVQEAIDAVVTDLALQGSGNDGGLKVGKYQSGTWHDGTRLATGSLSSQIDAIVSGLAAIAGNGGGDKVGLPARSSGSETLTAGSIYDQVGELLGKIAVNSGFNQLVRCSNFFRGQPFNDTSGPYGDYHAVAFDNEDRWVAVGERSGVGLISSIDNPLAAVAGDWNDEAPDGTSDYLFDVIWAEGLFVAVGRISAAGGAAVETSPDGDTWTARTATGMTTAGDLISSVAYDPETEYFVAVGGTKIIRSADGITWAAASNYPAVTNFQMVASDGSKYLLAVGTSLGGNNIAIFSSDGGDNWSTVFAPGTGTTLYGAAYDAKSRRWFISGSSSSEYFRSNVGGTTFENIPCTITWGFGPQVACDGYGTILYASLGDGIAVSIDGGETFHSVKIGDGTSQMVCAGVKYVAGAFWLFDNDDAPFAWQSLVSFGHAEENITYP